ncbi:hypothetical protein BCR44DRAFT_1041265 [Catenaria anguillulae PL171]|uniref:Uncharacterized protein n=1 Tax=Catenaria anguillulae PL171 TaxID=765915 RepID=A0A1Y2HRF6_9FUNG|nr:hypothetical protein BCR44DRAFT_1041265 [Catenaria anguillulae PL171]
MRPKRSSSLSPHRHAGAGASVTATARGNAAVGMLPNRNAFTPPPRVSSSSSSAGTVPSVPPSSVRPQSAQPAVPSLSYHSSQSHSHGQHSGPFLSAMRPPFLPAWTNPRAIPPHQSLAPGQRHRDPIKLIITTPLPTTACQTARPSLNVNTLVFLLVLVLHLEPMRPRNRLQQSFYPAKPSKQPKSVARPKWNSSTRSNSIIQAQSRRDRVRQRRTRHSSRQSAGSPRPVFLNPSSLLHQTLCPLPLLPVPLKQYQSQAMCFDLPRLTRQVSPSKYRRLSWDLPSLQSGLHPLHNRTKSVNTTVRAQQQLRQQH